jgi:hypothetical protein
MKRHRRTVLTLAVTTALAGLPAAAADAGSPILSGYGEPGAGEQEILGSQLLNGRSGGGPKGPSAGTGAAQSATSSTGEDQGVVAHAPAVDDGPGQDSAAASGPRQSDRGDRQPPSASSGVLDFERAAVASQASGDSGVGVSGGVLAIAVLVGGALLLVALLTRRLSKFQP